MMSCIYPKCPELAIVGDFCIKHFKVDHDRRRAVREEKMGKKESNPGPPPGAVKPPPPAPPKAPQTEMKVCKRCKKDKSGDKYFSKKNRLCHACGTTIRKYEKAGKPVPEYTGRRGSRPKTAKKPDNEAFGPISDEEWDAFAECVGEKEVVLSDPGKTEKTITINIANPLGKPAQKMIDEAFEKMKDKKRPAAKDIKKTEVVPSGDGKYFQIKTSVDPDYYLTVDFTDYPELKAALDGLARQDFRTPEMQVLAILDEFLNYAGKVTP